MVEQENEIAEWCPYSGVKLRRVGHRKYEAQHRRQNAEGEIVCFWKEHELLRGYEDPGRNYISDSAPEVVANDINAFRNEKGLPPLPRESEWQESIAFRTYAGDRNEYKLYGFKNGTWFYQAWSGPLKPVDFSIFDRFSNAKFAPFLEAGFMKIPGEMVTAINADRAQRGLVPMLTKEEYEQQIAEENAAARLQEEEERDRKRIEEEKHHRRHFALGFDNHELREQELRKFVMEILEEHGLISPVQEVAS